ncbi:MAG: zinc ribbon domain-containing protein [Anaerolineales bacterium]|nr:zinc ribbon domain-containing protein [Anaerolineales bacterium]
MEIGAVFLLFAVILLVGLFLAQPYVENKRGLSHSITAAERERSALLAERDRIVNALEELDFDHALGKIPEEEYPVQRKDLLNRGASVLSQLNTTERAAKDPLEAAAASLRDGKGIPALDSEDELESMIAARRAKRKDKSAGFCPKCGKPVLRSDRFCPSCGKPTHQEGNS